MIVFVVVATMVVLILTITMSTVFEVIHDNNILHGLDCPIF